MCTVDYLHRLAELSDGLMTLYMQKLAILGEFKEIATNKDNTESNEIASSEDFACPKNIMDLLGDLFRKLLTIAVEQKWNDYADLLDAFKKAVEDIPGLKPIKMDADTKKMYEAVVLLLEKSKEAVAIDDKNSLISCKNLIYKAD